MTDKEKATEIKPTEARTIEEQQAADLEYYKRLTKLNHINGIEQREGYYRKAVIHYPSNCGPSLAHNVEDHFNAGYRFIYSMEPVKDDRLYGPNSTQRPTLAPTKVTGKTSDGFQYSMMEIPVDQLNKHLEEKAQKEHEKYLASIKGSVKHGKKGLTIQEQEAVFNKTNK